MEGYSKSPPSSQGKYNTNANIFHPYRSISFTIKCSNLPDITSVDEFTDFLKNIREIHGVDLDDSSFNVVKLGLKTEGELDNFVILEIFKGDISHKLIGLLQGYMWGQKLVKVSIIEESEQGTYATPTSYFNPYYLNYPYSYNNFYYSNNVPSYPTYNNLTPKHTSRRSSFKSVDSRRSSKSETTEGSNTKPVPHFLLNLVNGTDDDTENTEFESEVINNDNFTTIKDDDGNEVKVNTCRLFVGNIPFTSTWPALKNFIISTCENMEPENDIRVLKVEIPIQSTPAQTNHSDYHNQYSAYLKSYPNGYPPFAPPTMRANENIPTGKSRGFAIVTTADQISSSKIIEYLDSSIFEGRKITVRYDKFPDFNNYTLQQLHPYNNSKTNKTSVLSHLAFERNLFQQKFYYGNNTPAGSMQNPFGYYGFIPNGPMNNFNPQLYPRPPYYSNYSQALNYFEGNYSMMYNYSKNFVQSVPRNNGSKYPNTLDKTLHHIDNQTDDNTPSEIDDDKKARELVNSLSSFKLTS